MNEVWLDGSIDPKNGDFLHKKMGEDFHLFEWSMSFLT